MFRYRPSTALLLALALAAAVRPAGAQEPRPADGYREILATGVDPAADTRRLARALADRWIGDGELAWYFVDGTGEDGAFDEPAFALVAGFPAGGDLRLDAMASALAALEAIALSRPARDVAMLMLDEAAHPAVVPASAAELLDPESTAVIVLLPGEPSAVAEAGASGMLSPLSLLSAVRDAFRSAGEGWRETPVEDLLARIKLAPGSRRLGSWMEAGYAAIALSASPGTLTALASRSPLQGARGQDVNYLRYPIPGSRLTIGDPAIVAIGCLAGTLLALYAFFHPRRRESFREALIAFGLVLLALYAGQGLSWAFRSLGNLLPRAAPAGEPGTVALALRTVGVVASYYAISGLAARLGLSLASARISAIHAGAALFATAALAGLALAPIVIPFGCLFAFMMLAGGRTLVSSGAVLAASLAIVAPFALPVFSGAHPETVKALLSPAPVLSLGMALAISPFTLWLGAAVSPGSALRRGRRPAQL